MKYKINNIEEFESNVFGADCFIKHWPEILDEGVELEDDDGWHYIMKNGERENDTAFFSEDEMQFLEKIEHND